MNKHVDHEWPDAGLQTLVAVYGTLKRGFANHHLMQQATFLGDDCLVDITLYDLGPYPGAKALISEGIDVEVYAVSPAQMAALDRLEEYNTLAPEQGLYNRLQFQTRFGKAWIYLYNPNVNAMTAQRRGGWVPAVVQSAPAAQSVASEHAGTSLAANDGNSEGINTDYRATEQNGADK